MEFCNIVSESTQPGIYFEGVLGLGLYKAYEPGASYVAMSLL